MYISDTKTHATTMAYNESSVTPMPAAPQNRINLSVQNASKCRTNLVVVGRYPLITAIVVILRKD